VEGRVFNLGHGKEISVGDLAEMVRGMVGRDVAIELDELRLRPPESEVERLCSDPSAARESIGWQPQCSLREGLQLTIDWIRGRGRQHATEEFAL
jgi:dTDP-glucose 4,6-dehydratase